MDSLFIQLTIGLFTLLIGTAIIYLFRIRQLYLVIPQLFSHSAISTNGKVAELKIINHGKRTEEDIKVALDPSLQYEVISATTSDIKIEDSILSISRLSPMDTISIIVLIEGGDFGKEKISSISSKDIKGKIIENIDSVIPNIGNTILTTLSYIAIVPLVFFGLSAYDNWDTERQIDQLSYISEQGWEGLEKYAESDFRSAYSDAEFPIYQESITRKGDVVSASFIFINKAATEVKLTALTNGEYTKKDPNPLDGRNIFSLKILPASKEKFTIKQYLPKEDAEAKGVVSFTISVGGEYIHSIKKVVEGNV